MAGVQLVNPVATHKIAAWRGNCLFHDGGFVFHLNLRMVLPAAILVGGFLVCTTASYGTAEYYKDKKTLDGYVAK
jgi:hypothetical protein